MVQNSHTRDAHVAICDGFAPFSVRPSLGPRPTGLIFASAHSGTHYPADMNASASSRSVRMAEDACMDRLIEAGASAGATTLLALIGRAYVDLNRADSDLDPALIEGCEGLLPNGKTLAGYGVLHRLGGDGAPLYSRRLSLQEAQDRLARVHAPYHAQLSQLMHQSLADTGRAVLIDWHSMPARATGPNGPDIILGDRHGSSCDVQWTRTLKTLFEAQGWRVGLNRPYAGGYATQKWGRPADGLQAVQVEVNRRLYWDEDAHAPGIGWKRCHSAMKRVISQLCQQAADTL